MVMVIPVAFTASVAGLSGANAITPSVPPPLAASIRNAYVKAVAPVDHAAVDCTKEIDAVPFVI